MSDTDIIEDEQNSFDSKFYVKSNNVVENNNVISNIDKIKDMIDSNTSITKNLIILTLEMLVVLLIECFNDDVAFLFIRKQKTSLVEAFSSICIILDLIKNAVPLALTQGYSFLITKLFANQSHKEINILTNKMIFILSITGLFFGISIATYFGPLVSLGFDGRKVSHEITYMMRWLSIGIPFSIVKMGFSRYLFSLNLGYIATVSSIIGLIVQIGFSFLFIMHFELVEFGLINGINLGAITSFLIQIIYITTISEYSYKFREDFTFLYSFNEISKFLVYLCKMGGIVFISIFSFISISFLGMMLDDLHYSILNIFSLFLMLFFMFSDALTAACNVMINFCIGEKIIVQIKRVFLISLLLLTISICILTIISYFLFEGILAFYIEKKNFINEASIYKFSLLFTMVLYSYQTIFSEVASILKGEFFSTIVILIKYLISLTIGIVLVKSLNYNIDGILNGMIIGQLFFILCFLYYFYLLFENSSFLIKQRVIKENDFDNSLQEILFLENTDKENGNIKDEENSNLIE